VAGAGPKGSPGSDGWLVRAGAIAGLSSSAVVEVELALVIIHMTVVQIVQRIAGGALVLPLRPAGD